MWKQTRFVIGLILVLLSTIGVHQLVSHARSGVSVYQAIRDIAPGEALTTENMRIVNARPESDAYLAATDNIDNLQAQYPLRDGELIARSFVATEHDLTMRSFVVTVDDGLPEQVTPG